MRHHMFTICSFAGGSQFLDGFWPSKSVKDAGSDANNDYQLCFTVHQRFGIEWHMQIGDFDVHT